MLQPVAPPPPALFAGLAADLVLRGFRKGERAAVGCGQATS